MKQLSWLSSDNIHDESIIPCLSDNQITKLRSAEGLRLWINRDYQYFLSGQCEHIDPKKPNTTHFDFYDYTDTIMNILNFPSRESFINSRLNLTFADPSFNNFKNNDLMPIGWYLKCLWDFNCYNYLKNKYYGYIKTPVGCLDSYMFGLLCFYIIFFMAMSITHSVSAVFNNRPIFADSKTGLKTGFWDEMKFCFGDFCCDEIVFEKMVLEFFRLHLRHVKPLIKIRKRAHLKLVKG